MAGLLLAAAEGRPELKRKLRMELAAAQGVDHLAPEVDKRLASLETSRSKVSWRARPAFIRDVEALRTLIAGPLAELDRPGALARFWPFMGLAPRLEARVRDKHGDLAALSERAAADVGSLVAALGDLAPADALVEAHMEQSSRWRRWLPVVLERAPSTFAAGALQQASESSDMPRNALPLIRMLADAAGEVDAYLATFKPGELAAPAKAASAARRLLAVGRVEEAGDLLRAPLRMGVRAKLGRGRSIRSGRLLGSTTSNGRGRAPRLRRCGGPPSSARCLSSTRERSSPAWLIPTMWTEGRALAYAAAHRDFAKGLNFLMDWPAIPAAAAMIKARSEEATVPPEQAELWAGRLRTRQPAAAGLLLRKAAAAAFRRREFAICNRLTAEADALDAA